MAFGWLLSWFVRTVVALRYRVVVHGWERTHNLRKPVLLLPNHPGFIDPVLLFGILYRSFRPRIVLYEGNFPPPLRFLLVRLLRVVTVPDLQHPSREARQRTEQAVAEIIAGLHRGENFILWPSGRVQRDGTEQLGASRALTDLLKAVPEATIVPIRTRGIWGSSFSFARTGRLPNLGRCLRRGALLLAANLIFFAPRRQVEITIEPLDRARLPELDRDAVNHWFEAWYNVDGPERPTYVPDHFLFGPREYDFPQSPLPDSGEIDSSNVPQQTRDAVLEILAEQLHHDIEPDVLDSKTRLDELGLDSLQRMDLAIAIEQRFGNSGETAPETVGQLMAVAAGFAKRTVLKAPPEWFRPPAIASRLRIMADTIPAAFVARALSGPRNVAAADDLSRVVTYERLLVGALLMARRFAELPVANVGLMLPASVASDTMLLGLYLANKLPVLLNWTTGPANLRHAVTLTGLTHVVSSRQMRDRLNLEIEGVQFLDVEDLSRQVGWFSRIRMLLAVRCLPGWVRRQVNSVSPDAAAVILFTSGSEKAPKAVPLTHRNVISNLRIVPAILDLTTNDAVLGFLPMFHSFGFTMTGLFPLLGGIRVVHHANPTDATGLARKIAAYSTTVLVGMPSLIARVFERAAPGELKSLRLIVVGAEKCPPALFEIARRVVPDAVLLEGYGITECSPAVAANLPNANRPGTVGPPLPGVEVMVVDLETNDALPAGKMGMLLVAGPCVFNGYLGDEVSPFVYRNGKRWYVTGDLAALDSDGYIEFRGRLKRFIKAGGEMISLPALEEPFSVRYPPDENGPRVAVEGIETETGRIIVLFTTESIDLHEANSLLSEHGFRGVMHLDEVHRLERLPTLGGGKIDYRRLRSMIVATSAISA